MLQLIGQRGREMEFVAVLIGKGDRLRMQEQAPLPRHVEILFEFSLMLIKAQLEWLEKLIAEIEAGDLLLAPPP